MVALQEPATPVVESPSSTRPAGLRVAIAAVAALPPLTQISYLVAKSQDAWTYLFADDAYYYLGVARNIGAGRGSTFSGLTETNGYHPLWELMLSAVAFVFRDPHALVAAVVVLQGLLWLLLVREALRIGRAVGSETAAVVGTALLGLLAVVTGQLSFSGMESAPLLVFALTAIRMIVTLRDGDRAAEIRLGIVLALVVLTRLDAALTVVPLAALVALRGRPPLRETARRGARLLAPSAGALVAYVAANLALFGTATPVSGQAKSQGGPFTNWVPLEQFFQAGQIGERPIWLGVLSLAVCAAAFVLGDWRSSVPRQRLMAVTGCLLVGQALLVTYLVVATSYRVWAWYYYGIALVLFTAGTLVAIALVERLATVGPRLCVAVGVAFAIGQIPGLYLSGFNHSERATATVEFLANELPEDAVIAMGDRAGLVGYLADRPMLQLEGLMADERWLHELEAGTANDRMIEEGVEYYVWSGYVNGRWVEHDGWPCQVLTEPRAGGGPKFGVTVCAGDTVFNVGAGNDQFTVFRFRPEVNR
jgi:hypothetical protein